ncbi:caspase domain-containing protein [Aspergillus pseudoustus]|uniref:Caspase domain-containing protein n=1 Tax=Aspergillus pseudoustus TaxID=1810923 RepID=A0ABR4J3H4_9EURO
MNPDSETVNTVRKALLIGSPTYGLKGPLNDVENIANLLRLHGFSIQECCGPQATRDGIIKAWNQLNSEVQANDTVLIYYSGHGGLVKDPQNQPGRRYQFIVPSDYAPPSRSAPFKGIFDIELSQLIHNTTDRTRNVTLILDCCFSGRMARDPAHGRHAVKKALENVLYDQVSEAYERLLREHLKQAPNPMSIEGNPHAVRVVAAADSEAAFEYDEGNGQMVGAFTKALLANLDGAFQAELTWKHLIMMVSEHVSTHFPYQHPHAEGPFNRIVFSQQERDTNVYPVDVSDEGEHILCAGQTAGVRVGNTYRIIYNQTTEGSEDIATSHGTVTDVSSLHALVKTKSSGVFGKRSALAYPATEVQYRYTVSVPDNLKQYINNQMRNMKFIQLSEENTTSMIFAHLDKQAEAIHLSICNEPRATFDAAGENIEGAVSRALHLANSISRAAHLLSSKPSAEVELDHGLRIGFSTAETEGRAARELSTDGTAHVDCQDRICISLNNTGNNDVYVSVFNVTAAGKIFLISKSAPRGIRVRPGNLYVMGKAQHTGIQKGMMMFWPEGIPRVIQGSIPEWFVCFITNTEIDLRCLENDFSATQSPPAQRGDPSQLEKVAYQLSYGQGRSCGGEEESALRWDLIIVPFSLSPVQT